MHIKSSGSYEILLNENKNIYIHVQGGNLINKIKLKAIPNNRVRAKIYCVVEDGSLDLEAIAIADKDNIDLKFDIFVYDENSKSIAIRPFIKINNHKGKADHSVSYFYENREIEEYLESRGFNSKKIKEIIKKIYLGELEKD